jgi:hypothetical protein
MTSDRDEKRLVHRRGEAPEVRALLEAGITGEVSDYDFEGGLHAHLAAVGAAPPAPGEAGSSPGAAGTPPGAASIAPAKAALAWIGVPVATLGVAAALWLGAGRPSAPGNDALRPSDVAPAVVTPVPPGNQAANARPAPAPRDLAAAESPTLGAAPRGAPSASAHHHQTAQSRAATSPNDERPASLAGSVGSVTLREETPAPAASAPTSNETADRASTDGLAEPSSDDAAKRAAERLRRDMDLLADAKRALATDPALALTLARRGEAEMPRSLLAEERRHVLILALIGLGRTSEARRIAAPYLRQHPDSPFARRVQSALDASSSSGP